MSAARTASRAMLTMAVLCACGMAAGLILDARAGRLLTLAALCSGTPPGFLHLIRLHWQLLPDMHLGMLLAAACPALLKARHGTGETLKALSGSAACFGLMLAGMSAGTLVLDSLASPSARPAPILITAMLLGMLAVLPLGAWLAALPRIPHLPFPASH